MSLKREPPVQIQRRYYTDTAAQYDSMHAQEASTDRSIIRFVHAFLRMIDARSLLDVGCATALGLAELQHALPDLFTCGVEPVRALIAHGLRKGMPSRVSLLQASGDALPFSTSSFDAVCEFGVLHHAANPGAVITEMLRVARKAVFICDSNRFGQGSRAARVFKLILYKCRLWPLYMFLRTRGKGYLLTEGDGLSYSYSIYDSYSLVSGWADRIILIPVGNADLKSTWLHPLLTCGGILLCAFKERPQ